MDAVRRIVRDLRECSRRAEADVGVSAAQLFVLQHLTGGRTASVNELAALTLTHQSSVSAVVTKLANLRLVTRARCPLDGRRIEIALTRRGQRVLHKAPEAAQGRLVTAIARLTTNDRRKLAMLLTLLTADLGDGSGPPPMLFEE